MPLTLGGNESFASPPDERALLWGLPHFVAREMGGVLRVLAEKKLGFYLAERIFSNEPLPSISNIRWNFSSRWPDRRPFHRHTSEG